MNTDLFMFLSVFIYVYLWFHDFLLGYLTHLPETKGGFNKMRNLTNNRTSLLTKCFFLLCFSVLPLNIAAQHCPFDGTRMIVVHLTDEKDQAIVDAVQSLTLREIDNPNADACTYAEGLLEKPFLLANDAFTNIYKTRSSVNLIQEYCADCSFLTDGFYAVRLGQAETNCMIKKDGDFTYQKRKYEIRFEKNGVKKIVKVSDDKIYSLCTDGGKWSRIVPIKMKIE